MSGNRKWEIGWLTGRWQPTDAASPIAHCPLAQVSYSLIEICSHLPTEEPCQHRWTNQRRLFRIRFARSAVRTRGQAPNEAGRGLSRRLGMRQTRHFCDGVFPKRLPSRSSAAPPIRCTTATRAWPDARETTVQAASSSITGPNVPKRICVLRCRSTIATGLGVERARRPWRLPGEPTRAVSILSGSRRILTGGMPSHCWAPCRSRQAEFDLAPE